jgi:nucleotide-binding universal stress UspA family protein
MTNHPTMFSVRRSPLNLYKDVKRPMEDPVLEGKVKNESGAFMRNIVFATDFLESSRLALDYAVAFAHHFSAKLTIVNVFELTPEAEEVEMISHRPSISREHAFSRLEAFASGVRRLGIRTEIDLREGEPCAAVLSSAAENNADLLALGTHGVFRGLQHLLVGSNAEKILLAAPCPTLTVGRQVMAGVDLDLRFSEILLVADFSPEAATAARYAVSLARDLGIGVRLLQVKPANTPVDSSDVHATAERFCAELSTDPALSDHGWCDPGIQLERMVSAEEVVRVGRASVDRLLVLGVHSESRWNRHLRTSFAYELVARARCPLVSVHAR